MSDLDAELTDIFRQEAAERLDQMEAGLLAVEADGGGAADVDALFRHVHTIKGAAGMLGLDDIRALAHAAEDILASVREAGVFPPELAAPLLRATTVLRACAAGTPEPVGEVIADLTTTMAALAAAPPPAAAAPPSPAEPPARPEPPAAAVPEPP
jgi:two-component system, chemotaxis family, sensor kinase CheA